MTENNISQKFRLKNINKKINCFIEEINQNELMSKKHNNNCGILNYIQHLLILVSTGTECVPISASASLVGLKICVITAGIKKYKKKHEKIVLLAKTKLNSVEVLITKALID